MAFEELPTEIWLRVASFIPDDHLHNLAAVSQLFYWICTERTYRHLLLDDDRPLRLEARLTRLEKEPGTRQLVKSITFHPRAIRSACLRSGRNPKRVPGSGSPRDYISSFRTRMASFDTAEDLDLADRLSRSLATLPSTSELHVEWERPYTAEMPFCFALLKDFAYSLGPRLTALSLSTSLEVMAFLAESIHELPSIQTLRLNLGPKMDDPHLLTEDGPPQQNLARFLNTLSPTLRSLSVTCMAHYSLSALFNSLEFFRHLRSLRLQLPFDQDHLSDPTGMNTFLRAHPAIEHLSFTQTHCCSRKPSLVQASSWTDPDTWLNIALSNVKFSKIHTLEVGLNTAGGAPRVLPATSRMGTLVHGVDYLKIAGVIASVGELELVLRSFAEKGRSTPKSITLEVLVLSPSVMELLAALFPHLENLDLTCWNLAARGRRE